MSAHLELGRLADRFAHLEKFEILTSHVQRLLAEWDELVDLYEEAITNDEEWGPPVQDTVDIGTYYDDAGAEGTSQVIPGCDLSSDRAEQRRSVMSAQGLYDVIVTAHEAFTHRQFEDGSFADGEDDRRSLDTTIADAVREWAKENAELYFGGYGGDEDEWPQHLAPSHYSVPLDKFGGDE